MVTTREHSICCVCDGPISGPVRTMGGRTFCEEHCERAARENRAAATPLIIAIGAAVLLAALGAVLAEAVDLPTSGAGLVAAGVVMAIVPALIWLAAFYRLDLLEPEPKHYVIAVVLLGAVMAEAVGQPLIRGLFRVQDWLYDDALTGILGSILVIGFLQEFLKYAVVRYTVFRAREFDERVDGIIYGAAAGLGYATMLNLRYVLSNGGVDLGVGAIQVAVTALAQASFGGVTGYFLGRAKFERMGPLWLPIGLTLAAVLNGVTTYLIREIPLLEDFDYNPWYGLVLAAVVAVATFGALFYIVRRVNAASLASPRAA